MHLTFLIPFHKYTNTFQMKENQILKSILIIPFGLLAGCSNENSGGAVMLLILCFMGYWLWKKKRIPVWSITGFLSVCGGVGILLLSPSSQSKMGAITFAVLLKRIREVVGFSYRHVLLLMIILFVVTWIFIRERKIVKKDWIGDLIIPYTLCAMGAASVLVLLASSVIAGKSWIWAVCFMLIAIGKICCQLAEDGYKATRWMKILLWLFIVWSVARYGAKWQNINRTYHEAQQQIQMIEEQKAQGKKDATIYLLTPTLDEYNAASVTPNVSTDKEAWFNQWMELYYGVDSVTGIER